MKSLDQYFLNTRVTHKERFSEEVKQRWVYHASLCTSLFGTDAIDLIFLESLSKRSEFFVLSERKILIFDYQFLRTSIKLTRIFYTYTSIYTLHGYFGKLLADEAILAGNKTLAQCGIATYGTLYPTWNSFEDKPTDERRKWVWVHELFILFHEFSHAATSSGTKIEKNGADLSRRLSAGIRVANWKNLARESFVSHGMNDFFINDYIDKAENVEEFIYNHKSGFSNEVVCDATALLLVSKLGHNNEANLIQVLCNVLLCMKNLQLINHIRAYVRQVTSGIQPTGTDELVTRTSARISHLIVDMFPFLLNRFEPMVDATRVVEGIIRFSDSYDRRVISPFFGYMSHVNKMIHGDARAISSCKEAVECLMLAKKLGWEPRATQRCFLQF